eukprot:1160762-Pelagomonas_calceolata.AAC.1
MSKLGGVSEGEAHLFTSSAIHQQKDDHLTWRAHFFKEQNRVTEKASKPCQKQLATSTRIVCVCKRQSKRKALNPRVSQRLRQQEEIRLE